MTVRPIIFSDTTALLDGRKTMTRQILTRRNVEVLGTSWAGKSYPWEGLRFAEAWVRDRSLSVPFCHPDDEPTPTEDCGIYRIKPIIQPGDLLWVRETVSAVERLDGLDCVRYAADQVWIPIADTREAAGRWMDLCHYRGKKGSTVPPIHMPRWACRLTLKVTGVKVERLQDISKEDVTAEGVTEREGTSIKDVHAGWHEPFAALWDSINGKKPGCSWSDNPFVIAISFSVIRTGR